MRYYLLKMMKDKLPDVGSEYEGTENGDVTDERNEPPLGSITTS